MVTRVIAAFIMKPHLISLLIPAPIRSHLESKMGNLLDDYLSSNALNTASAESL